MKVGKGLRFGVPYDHYVTSYIHAMANHVSKFMQLHGSLLTFTQQSLEKYNDIVTNQYFRNTNHQRIHAFRQIVEKQNCVEYLRDSGVQTKKCFEVTCGNFKEKGHNKGSCPDLETTMSETIDE